MKKNNTIIIAEAGVNHNGNINIGKKLIDVAANSGANFVKFQSFLVDDLILKKTKTASYQKKNLKKNVSQYQMLKKYELSAEDHFELFKHAKKRKIKFLSTPFDLKSLNFLKKFNLEYIKIPSGEITNFLMLNKISKLKKKVILSTGMSNLDEIKTAIKVLNKKKEDLILLHCTSDYPARPETLNLNFLNKLKNFGYKIGYSDHSESILTPAVAVSLGCKIIEKHFTLSKKMQGPDHRASLEPKELYEMVKMIRYTESVLGAEDKKITESEKKTKVLVRKSIVAAKTINIGEKFTYSNLTTKRPGDGLSPFLLKKIIGKKSKLHYLKDEKIK